MKSPTYKAEASVHRGMLTRCYNTNASNYSYYGGRGISVCSAWRGRAGLPRFIADVGTRPSNEHSLDRVDCNGNYEPGNVRWVLRAAQAHNRRSVVLVTLDGRTRNLTEWAEITGIKVGTSSRRIRLGWDPAKAVSEPVHKKAKSIVDMPDATSENRSTEHNTWYGMRNRCYCKAEPSYPDYGGRGIRVCERWMAPDGFQKFLEDVGPRPSPAHSLDRINVNSNYSPDNCRWATGREQARNTRATTKITARGEARCLKDWAAVSGIPVRTIGRRLQSGWDPESAIFTPGYRMSPVEAW